MAIQYLNRDLITLSISYIVFWVIIIVLILYPIFKSKKIMKRIKSLEKKYSE